MKKTYLITLQFFFYVYAEP